MKIIVTYFVMIDSIAVEDNVNKVTTFQKKYLSLHEMLK